MFKLPQLTYPKSALEPFLSTEAVEYHHGKHHKAYVNEVNRMIQGTKFEHETLEDIILHSDGPLFNNASQAWNHTFYWRGMCAAEKVEQHAPSEKLISEFKKAFGSMNKFKELFTEQAVHLFGAGWVWVVADAENRVSIISLPNAESPLRHNLIPLLACDVWEHAYYIDYRNNRRRYVEGYLNAIDWAFVGRNLEARQTPDMTRFMAAGGRDKKVREKLPEHSVA